MTEFVEGPVSLQAATSASRWPMPLSERATDAFCLLGNVTSTNALLRTWCHEGNDFVACLLRAQAAESVETAESAEFENRKPAVGMLAADTQTAGHGRLGRAWMNEPGRSFIVSFVMPLPRALVCSERSGWLTMAAGLAAQAGITEALDAVAARSMDDSARGIELKWPNDVFIAGLKLGGILTEVVELPSADASSPSPSNTVALIIGIGLNLLLDPESLPTAQSTSLQLYYGPLPDFAELRDRIGAGIANALRREFAALLRNPAAAATDLRRRLTAVCWTLGRPVEARLVDGSTITGVAQSIASDAALVVRRPGGALATVHTADVGVLPQSATGHTSNERAANERRESDERNA